ncbi:hypothetical protein FIBSPDRAFT_940026 [Athelia psychrophila]|uniref:Uncharacterized protein n=1 Tax=Athelia psychrophila TaxID=1759441 RepID=A0A167WQW8_9AGAM|nr:hypothetical protein FIBSPDRAFT_940026 [Fibularhizoctonia sp. CBS 109695]
MVDGGAEDKLLPHVQRDLRALYERYSSPVMSSTMAYSLGYSSRSLRARGKLWHRRARFRSVIFLSYVALIDIVPGIHSFTTPQSAAILDSLLALHAALSQTGRANDIWAGFQFKALMDARIYWIFLKLALPEIFIAGTEWCAKIWRILPPFVDQITATRAAFEVLMATKDVADGFVGSCGGVLHRQGRQELDGPLGLWIDAYPPPRARVNGDGCSPLRTSGPVGQVLGRSGTDWGKEVQWAEERRLVEAKAQLLSAETPGNGQA